MLLVTLLAAAARGQDTPPPSGPAPAGGEVQVEEPVRTLAWARENLATSYALEGVRSIRLTGSIADDLSNTTTASGTLGVSWFLYDSFEVGVEVGAWNFNHPGDNAGALSISGMARWHFLVDDERDWTLFLDGGMGLLYADPSVPSDGSQFNFLPRLGAGATYRLTHGGARLEAGIAWQHVSNARIFGDQDNPGLDSARLFVGLIFPF